MKQDERWIQKFNEVKTYIETNRRNPSKHRIEEHDMLNWVKANRKALNAGTLKPERVEQFRKLLELMERYKRKNQYQ
ncbi:MAG: helicase associated domain-containing protein [Prevotella sp.]|nr:helicase associated domain-containing protein [Prevotella sp.]